ncbi:MAG: hypothetical protein RIR11_1043 [Bacteroidota bacterium]|jgi:hypothetical protein
MEFCFRLAAFVGMDTFLMWLNRIIKPATRSLSVREKRLAQSIFGDSINLEKVRIDETSRIACKPLRLAYVGFNVINCWGPLSDAHLIHELVHVWQYQTFGVVYIPRALWAQNTEKGYDYGGIRVILKKDTPKFTTFNYEQQGDIVADYFRLKTGQIPQWCPPDKRLLPYFEAILNPYFARDDA